MGYYHLNEDGHIINELQAHPFEVGGDGPTQPRPFDTIEKANAWLAKVGKDLIQTDPVFNEGQQVKLVSRVVGFLQPGGPFDRIEQPKGTVGTVREVKRAGCITTYVLWVEPGICHEKGFYSEFSNHNAPISTFIQAA